MANTPSTSGLSPLESEVMDFVWARRAVTADDVEKALGGRLTNATVRTLLRRVEAKGFVTHRQEGRTFVYEPRVEPGVVARGLVRRLVERFYGGSVEQLVVGLLDGKMIDRRTLDQLARRVADVPAGGRKRRKR